MGLFKTKKEERKAEQQALRAYLRGVVVWDSLNNVTALSVPHPTRGQAYTAFGSPAYGANRATRRFWLSNSKKAKAARKKQEQDAALGLKS